MRASAPIRILLLCIFAAMLSAPAAWADEKAEGWTEAAKGELDLGPTGERVIEGTLGLSEVACNDCQWAKTQTVTDKDIRKLDDSVVGISLGTVTLGKATTSPSGAVVLGGRTLVIPVWDVPTYGESQAISTLMVPLTRTAVVPQMDPLGKALDILISSPSPDKGAVKTGAAQTGQQSTLALRDYGISLGGPIVKDKLWFFGNYQQPPAPEHESIIQYLTPPGGWPDIAPEDSVVDQLQPYNPFGAQCNDAVHGGDQIKIKIALSPAQAAVYDNVSDPDNPQWVPVDMPASDADYLDEDDMDGAFFNISPRISLTYDITGDGKTVLRGNNLFQMGTRMTFDGGPATPATPKPTFYGGASKAFLSMLEHAGPFGTSLNTGGGLDGLSFATPGGYLGGRLGFSESGPRLGDTALGSPIIKDKLWFFGSNQAQPGAARPSGTPAVSDRLPTFWMLNLGLDGALKQPRDGELQCTGAAVMVESPDGMCPWQPGAVPWIDPFRQSYLGKKNVSLDDFMNDIRSHPGVVFVEPICFRFKQETPDDEYYLNLEDKEAREKAKGKKKRTSLLGFGLKLFKKAQEGTISIGGYDDDAGPEVMNQWSLTRVGYRPVNIEDVPSAWNTTTGENNPVVVAVIDSGLDMTHPDFSLENLWINKGEVPGNLLDDDGNGYVDDVLGWNFVDWNNAPFDDDGHGTLVAGIIAARTNNGRGIAGINWGAKIMPLKVSDSEGRTNSFDVAKAIIYAANNGARVINLSFGGREVSGIEQMAVDYANARGAIVVAASGNEGVNISDYSPAALRGVITVGGTGFDDLPVETYNFGQNVFVAAPSERIFSLRARNTSSLGKGLVTLYSFGDDRLYYTANGTSFSAPIVSGTVSLMLSVDPTLTLDEVRWKLLQGVVSKSKGGWDAHAGFGRIDAISALEADPKQGMTLAWIERPEAYKDKVLFFGSARAANFKGYTLEIGKGKKPSSWTAIQESKEQTSSGVLGMTDAESIFKSRDWSLRLRVTTGDGGSAEATYQFDSRDLKR